MNLLPPKGTQPKNFRTQNIEYRVEIVDYQTVKTIDENISNKDLDALFGELIENMLEQYLFNVADMAMQFIVDRNSLKYLLTLAKIRVF